MATKPLRKQEDIDLIPQDKPVLIELDPSADDGGAETVVETTTVEAEPEIDPAVKTLQDQLEAAKTAAKTNEDRLTQLDKDRRDALKAADDARKEANQSRGEREETERDLISNSLSSAQAEQSAAEQEYAQAFAEGDGAKCAKAQGKIARAAAKILHYEGASAEMERQAEVRKTQPVQQQTPQQVDLRQAVQNDQTLLPAEREWVVSHLEVLTDTKKNNKLKVAHDDAMEANLSRGSPAYFQFLDERLGYKQPEKKPDEIDDDERTIIVSAPPSRDTRSQSTGQLNGSQVTLNPEQRDIAKSMGISEVEYAKGVRHLEQQKKLNPEKYGRR